jgi:hypothetical protein
MYMYICKPLLSADSMTAVCTTKGSSSPLGMEAVGSWATVGNMRSVCRGWWGRRWLVQRRLIVTQRYMYGPRQASSSPLGMEPSGGWATVRQSMGMCRGWSRHWQDKRWSVHRQVQITQQCGPIWESSSPLGLHAMVFWATEGNSLSLCRGSPRTWQGRGCVCAEAGRGRKEGGWCMGRRYSHSCMD